jgi:hypothetical protein
VFTYSPAAAMKRNRHGGATKRQQAETPASDPAPTRTELEKLLRLAIDKAVADPYGNAPEFRRFVRASPHSSFRDALHDILQRCTASTSSPSTHTSLLACLQLVAALVEWQRDLVVEAITSLQSFAVNGTLFAREPHQVDAIVYLYRTTIRWEERFGKDLPLIYTHGMLLREAVRRRSPIALEFDALADSEIPGYDSSVDAGGTRLSAADLSTLDLEVSLAAGNTSRKCSSTQRKRYESLFAACKLTLGQSRSIISMVDGGWADSQLPELASVLLPPPSHDDLLDFEDDSLSDASEQAGAVQQGTCVHAVGESSTGAEDDGDMWENAVEEPDYTFVTTNGGAPGATSAPSVETHATVAGGLDAEMQRELLSCVLLIHRRLLPAVSSLRARLASIPKGGEAIVDRDPSHVPDAHAEWLRNTYYGPVAQLRQMLENVCYKAQQIANISSTSSKLAACTGTGAVPTLDETLQKSAEESQRKMLSGFLQEQLQRHVREHGQSYAALVTTPASTVSPAADASNSGSTAVSVTSGKKKANKETAAMPPAKRLRKAIHAFKRGARGR